MIALNILGIAILIVLGFIHNALIGIQEAIEEGKEIYIYNGEPDTDVN